MKNNDKTYSKLYKNIKDEKKCVKRNSFTFCLFLQCMDFAFHNCLERVIQMHASAEEGKRSTLKLSADVLSAAAKALDSGCDKKKFLDMFSSAFMIPPKVEFDGEFQV